jgi:hypothetical protein
MLRPRDLVAGAEQARRCRLGAGSRPLARILPMTRPPFARLAPLGLVAALLAGCGHKDDHPAQTETAQISFSAADNGAAAAGNGSAAQTVAVNVPGFSAKLNVPGLDFGVADMSIDGIRFHPGTKLAGMNIAGAAGDGSGGEGHGTVEMRFTDPAAPDQLLSYYRQAAQGGGWTAVPPAAGQQFAATKMKADGREHLALQVTAGQGGGSTGRFLVTGG